VRRAIDATRKQVVALGQLHRLKPFPDRLAGPRGNLESHRAFGLALPDRCARQDFAATRDVGHTQGQQVTGPELAVDGQVEQRKIPTIAYGLQTHSDGPDFLHGEWRFLASQLDLVPGCTFLGFFPDAEHLRLP
jgi:hypothetical protein